jgi:hypothetical protein
MERQSFSALRISREERSHAGKTEHSQTLGGLPGIKNIGFVGMRGVYRRHLISS